MVYRIRQIILVIKEHYWEIYITYVLAWFSQAIAPNFGEELKALFTWGSLGLALFILLTVIGVLLFILDRLTKEYVFSQRIEPKFADIMRRHTDEVIVDDIEDSTGGGFSWGKDRTVAYCKDLINGWKPEDICIASYDDNEYSMKNAEESKTLLELNVDWKGLFADYQKTSKYKNIIDRKNNLPRFMLTKFEKNFNKDKPKLFLSLQRTDWVHCQCVWEYFRKEENRKDIKFLLQKQIQNKFKNHYLPNSLCLHLLIETSDGEAVISTISKYKVNDYPNTIAATLGEQIDAQDFNDGQSFQEPFIRNWTKRAFMEELGLGEDQYMDLVDDNSIRVLSVDMEGDIYNFTIMCIAKLRCSMDAFRAEVKCTTDAKEIASISPLKIDDIPDILIRSNEEEESKKYHPSTYLRLLMFYLHKKGIKQTEKDLIQAENNYKKA